MDVIDIEFASNNVTTLQQYEKNDKALDLWCYTMSLFYSYFKLNYWFNFLLVLYLYRLIGDLIFFTKGKRKIFLFFPNLFESAFFLLFFSTFFSNFNFLIKQNNLYLSLGVVSVIKMFQEWWVHWAQISIPEDFFGIKRNWRKT